MARPLHLACARPPCGLKASLGLSLLRKRQFLHSILFFKRKLQHGLLCGLRRGIRCDWYRIACKENKNGTCSLTTCTPRFLFCEKTPSVFAAQSQLPLGGSLWRNGKLSGLIGNCAAMPKAPSPRGLAATSGSRLGEFRYYFPIPASCLYSCAAPPPGYFTLTKALFRMHTPSEYTVSRNFWFSASS